MVKREFVNKQQEFLEQEAKSCSMDDGCMGGT